MPVGKMRPVDPERWCVAVYFWQDTTIVESSHARFRKVHRGFRHSDRPSLRYNFHTPQRLSCKNFLCRRLSRRRRCFCQHLPAAASSGLSRVLLFSCMCRLLALCSLPFVVRDLLLCCSRRGSPQRWGARPLRRRRVRQRRMIRASTSISTSRSSRRPSPRAWTSQLAANRSA